MGLVQREAERLGMSTTGISLAREVTAQVKPPRALYLRYPFGHPLGEPFHRRQQQRILRDVLALLETVTVPGTIVESPYRWRRTRFD